MNPEEAKPPRSQSPARLSGEELEKWYGHKETPKHDRPGTWALILLAMLWPFLGFPFFAPILIPIFAIWLVIGSGIFWIRVLVATILVFSFGWWRPLPSGFFLLELFVAITLVYLLALALPFFDQKPTRPIQFSLWNFGGFAVILAVSMAVLRARGFNKELFPQLADLEVFLIFGCLLSTITVMACASVIVPRRYRSNGLFGAFAVLVTLAFPVLELFTLRNLPDTKLFVPYLSRFAKEFYIEQGNSDADYVAMVLLFTHVVGVPIAWLITFLMEHGRLFCDVASPTLIEQPVEQPIRTGSQASQ